MNKFNHTKADRDVFNQWLDASLKLNASLKEDPWTLSEEGQALLAQTEEDIVKARALLAKFAETKV